MEIMVDINELKTQVEKDKRFMFLKCWVADSEQYSLINDIIISWLETRL